MWRAGSTRSKPLRQLPAWLLQHRQLLRPLECENFTSIAPRSRESTSKPIQLLPKTDCHKSSANSACRHPNGASRNRSVVLLAKDVGTRVLRRARLGGVQGVPVQCAPQGPKGALSYSAGAAQVAETVPALTIDTLLVANRGEIACRILRTAKKLGIRTVAVYSEADAKAEHVRQADEAVCIGPAASSKSYLVGEKVLEAAVRTGAQAIHPGYGFLSENAKFAELCSQRGVEFVGPPVAAITAMGSKSASKDVMSAAGVPLVPGYHGENQDPAFLEQQAAAIGYPLMIKATLGGGGKGMRIVQSADQFQEMLASAKREAESSFGDSRVLLERYLATSRHIEVQVFGDKHGNVVHLFERDCSVQRRHQKVIEEAPAPGVGPELRARIGQAAVDAAKAVGYFGAGTVEFIVDPTTMEFFFMEMNTRLQVEHPITEMITGQDLVEWQLRAASGEPLPVTQADLTFAGHAFEARVYAENVPRGFLPAGGKLQRCQPPEPREGLVRVDTGVREGDVISSFYDPMIAKLVVWGEDRGKALLRLRQALGEYQVAGTPTNIPFLQSLAAHPSFAAGDVSTAFIPKHREDLIPSTPPHKSGGALGGMEREALAVAAAGWCFGGAQGPAWSSSSGLRLNSPLSRSLSFSYPPEDFESTPPVLPQVTVQYAKPGEFRIQVGEDSALAVKVEAKPESMTAGNDSSEFVVEVEGHRQRASLVQYAHGGHTHVHLWMGGRHFHFNLPLRTEWEGDHSHGGADRGRVLTPMPGRVVKLVQSNGGVVKKGDPVLILEAMKMEHVVRAPLDGRVEGLQVKAGQQVDDGSTLFTVKDGAD